MGIVTYRILSGSSSVYIIPTARAVLNLLRPTSVGVSNTHLFDRFFRRNVFFVFLPRPGSMGGEESTRSKMGKLYLTTTETQTMLWRPTLSVWRMSRFEARSVFLRGAVDGAAFE